MLRQITDGFSLDTKILPLMYQYRTAALSQLEVLRRAQGFQAQWVVIPEESAESLAAYDQLEYQATIAPGSWIWGAAFKATLAGANQPQTAHIHIEDEGTRQFWESDYEIGNGYTLFGRDADDMGKMPIIFSQPIPVTPPGKLNVKIANENSSSVTVQLVLNVARICTGRMFSPQECLP